MNSLALTSALRPRIQWSQDAMAISLRTAGWLATNGLATLGVLALFFVLLGGFTLSGTILQIDNLTSRFLAADAVRQDQFQAIVLAVLAGVFTLIAVFRRAGLRAAFDVAGVEK